MPVSLMRFVSSVSVSLQRHSMLLAKSGSSAYCAVMLPPVLLQLRAVKQCWGSVKLLRLPAWQCAAAQCQLSTGRPSMETLQVDSWHGYSMRRLSRIYLHNHPSLGHSRHICPAALANL